MEDTAVSFTSFKCLCKKEVVNCNTGERLGFITDAEIDMSSGEIKYFIALCEKDPFSFKGKEYKKFSFCDITKIGDDIILISRAFPCTRHQEFPKRKKVL